MAITVLQNPNRLRFRVRVQPRASGNRCAGLYGDALKIQLTAPPVDGAANSSLVAFLAEALGVSRGAVRLVAGEHARCKIVEVATDEPGRVEERLRALSRPRSR